MNLDTFKLILLIVSCLCINIFARTDAEQFAKDAEKIMGEKANVADMPDVDELEKRSGANDVNNKQEYGVLSSMYLVYSKCRNVCKVTFDEVQYWKGLKTSYDRIRGWFDKQHQNAKRIRRIATELISGKGNVFAKLQKVEDLFDEIDNLAFYETDRLNNLIKNTEKYLDKSILLPSTETVCFGIHMLGTKVTGGSVKEEEYKEFWENSKLEAEEKLKEAGLSKQSKNKLERKVNNITEYINNSSRLDEVDISQYEEYKIIEASRVMAASSISASDMYYKWAAEALENYSKIQDKTKDLDDLNDLGMLSTWLLLEEINANNKLIRNQNEELKMYMHLLGLKMRDKSEKESLKYHKIENYDLMVLDIKNQIKAVKEEQEKL